MHIYVMNPIIRKSRHFNILMDSHELFHDRIDLFFGQSIEVRAAATALSAVEA